MLFRAQTVTVLWQAARITFVKVDIGYSLWGMSYAKANITMPAKGYAHTRGKFKVIEPLTINAKFSDTNLLNRGA